MHFKEEPVNYGLLEKGPWRFEHNEGALLFSQLAAANEWKVRPSEMGICSPEDDGILMTAYHRTHSFMVQYESQVRRTEMERERKRANKNAKTHNGVKIS